jgi:hypothetical protein
MAKMEHDDEKQDKKLIKKAFGMHDKQLHENKKTDLSALKKGGKVKKMAKGGVTGQAMRAVGRNLARAHNQKPGSK